MSPKGLGSLCRSAHREGLSLLPEMRSQEAALTQRLREALGIFDCRIFEIRLLYSRCLHPAQPRGTELCRYLGIQAGAELDPCPNTASSSSAA